MTATVSGRGKIVAELRAVPGLEHRQPRRHRRLGDLLHVVVAGDRGDEDVALERVQLHVGLGRHGRRPRHVLQERDLAEVVAGPELRHPASLLGDDDGALLDRVEAVTLVAFADDHVACRGLDGFERPGEPLEDRLG